MKKGIFCLVLTMIVTAGVFAQTNYIKPTFSVGFGHVGAEGGYSEGFTAEALDIDFVTAIGLTFGLETIMAWNDDLTATLPSFGLGYTYTAATWEACGKLMAVPMSFSGGMGINANGTYWFKDNLGLTGIVDLYLGLGKISWSMVALRVGISAKI